MKSPNAPAFRSAMGGYNKQDVNAYIAELSSSYESRLTDLEQKLSILTARAEAAEANVTDGEKLRKELDQANALIAAQTQQLEELEPLREELAAAKDTIASMNSAAADTREKLAGYDQVSAKVGAILLDANAQAEQIKASARMKADSRLQNASDALQKQIQAICAESSGSMTEIFHRLASESDRLLKEQQYAIAALLGNLTVQLNTLRNTEWAASDEPSSEDEQA